MWLYFVSGHALVPEAHELSYGSEPAADLISALATTPDDAERTTFVPADSFESARENEAEERLEIELSDAFWNLPEGERFAAAAQIVQSLQPLEGGKEVILLDDAAPGEIRDGNGRLVEPPFTPSDLFELRPWIVVVQPVPGALVAETIPVRAPSDRGDVTAALLQGGRLIAEAEVKRGSGDISLEGADPGDITLRLTVEADEGVTVDVPLRVAGG